MFLRATGADAAVDVAGVLAQANGVLTPPVFADAPAVDVMAVAGEPWTRAFPTTDTGGGEVQLELQKAPADAELAGDTVSWTPSQSGTADMIVAASDGTTVTALPVGVTVAPNRASAIGKLVDRIEGGAELYTTATWQPVEKLQTQAQRARKTASPAEFADLLDRLGDAIAGLRLLNPQLSDGSLDYTGIVTAPALSSSQLRALADGDNQTSWGDQRVTGIAFDFGPGFRVSADAFGIQARDTFPNRAEGTNVYGSDDGASWTLLTQHPNEGQDAAVEWIPVRDEVRDLRFRFLKFQVDEPGVPSDPAYPGIWSIADIRIDGVRSEATGAMDTVTMSSPAGAVVTFAIAFTTPDGRTADPVAATTDGSKLFLSTDEGLIDDAFRGATVLRPDGVVDAAWTQYTAKMFDGDATTHSDTRLNAGTYGNVWDFGTDSRVTLAGAELLVRQDGYGTSRIADMRLEGSNDLKTWTRLTPGVPAKTLEWQRWPVQGQAEYRYIRIANGQILGVAELRLFGSVVPFSG